MHPTADWYQCAGLAISGWACLGLFAFVVVVKKVQSWWVWICGVAGVAFELAAGTYLADTTAAKDVIGFVQDYPLLSFIAFVILLVLVFKLPFQAMPDKVHPAAITMSVAFFAFLLPTLMPLIPGQFGQKVNEARSAITEPVKKHTTGWFTPDDLGEQPAKKSAKESPKPTKSIVVTTR